MSYRFLGKVGNDEFGQFLIKTLNTNQVDTTHLTCTDSAFTTFAFVSIPEHGERSFVFARKPGADMLLQEEDIAETYIENARMLHMGSISKGCVYLIVSELDAAVVFI